MKRRTFFVSIALLGMIALLMTGCSAPKQPAKFAQLRAISELATLRCYYHNVAKYTEGENNLFKFGYKKLWLEYAGIVTVGIDVSKVSASAPDQSGMVKVTIPQAEVLTIDFDETSIVEHTDTGWFAGFSAEEKTKAFAFAQENMETTARENSMILMQGQERAKKVIEQYIQKAGAAVGQTYVVEWVELAEAE